MTTVTAVQLTEEIRRACVFLQTNKEDLARAGIPKKTLREQLQLIRLCVTTMKKHYPKAPEIHTELVRTGIYRIVSAIQSALNEDRALPTDEVQRLRSFLEFPQQFHDNFADMFLPQFAPWEVWLAGELRVIKAEHIDDPLFVIEWSERIEKKYKRRYEKEREAFYKNG